MRRLVALCVFLAVPLAVDAADKSITLPPDDAYAALAPGPDVALVRDQCGMCHSTDYIVMQPRGDAAQWQAVVTKMQKVFGAPLDAEQAKAVVGYLAAQYAPVR